MKAFEIKAFVADADTQLPQVSLQMGTLALNQLVLGVCLHIQQFFSAVSANYAAARLYVEDKDYMSSVELLRATSPKLLNNSLPQQLSYEVIVQGASINHWVFQTELLMQYARVRNQCENEYLIGDEAYTCALVYAALHTLHEWRVKSVKKTVAEMGLNQGSATGWHRERYDADLKGWPERFHFTPLTWSPLPAEDPSFYEVPAKA